MVSLRPDVSDENGFAVTTDRVLEEVGQLALTVRDVITLGITGGNDHLLQVGQTSVNIGSFLLGETFSTGLLDAFISSQID
jgi:hypothetical protein